MDDSLFDIPITLKVKGDKGDPGLSAYEIAVNNGFAGSEKEFIESLKGKDGDVIKQEVVREIVKEQPIIKTEIVKEVIKEVPLKAIDGKSAYEMWKTLGNKGSVEDYVLSLRGDDGLSAYELWLDQGHEGSESEFLEWLRGEDGKHTISYEGGKGGGSAGLLNAGGVGRLNSEDSVTDTDDIMILRSGSLFRITAETLAAYIVAENTTIKEITFADSPYAVLSTDERIYVDADTNNPGNATVVVNLISLVTAPLKPIHVQKTDSSANTVTITADGSDTINGASTKLITSQDVDHELVPASEWRLS